MHQLNLYVQEVINENAQLQMRLQMQERSNQMLVKQVQELKRGEKSGGNIIFKAQKSSSQAFLRQPRKPSGKVSQKVTSQRLRREESAEAEADLDEE